MSDWLKEGSPVREVIDKVGQLFIVTILWLICCLPIITICTSSTAYYYAVTKAVRHETGYPTKEFFAAFGRNLWRGFGLTLVFAAWVFFLLMNWDMTKTLNNSQGYWLKIGQIPLYIATACYMMFAFPVMSRFSVRGFRLFKLTLVMTLRHLPWAVLTLIGWSAIAAIAWYWSAVMIFVLPGLWCYASTFWIEPVLLKYMPPPSEEDADAWYYEDLKEKKND